VLSGVLARFISTSHGSPRAIATDAPWSGAPLLHSSSLILCAAIRISRHRRIGGDLGPLVVVATLGPDTEFAGTARAYRHVMENQQGNRPERVGVVWQFGGTSMRHVSQYHSCNMLMTPCELKRA
jgi:hypothetical protein